MAGLVGRGAGYSPKVAGRGAVLIGWVGGGVWSSWIRGRSGAVGAGSVGRGGGWRCAVGGGA